MGKKRYYCHFCDKHLADNPQTRKKHNLGLQHCTNKKLHYALFKDAKELLAEDESKQVCRRYMNTGQCQFGDACRYSHMTPEVRLQLRAQVDRKRQEDNGAVDIETLPQVPLEDWLRRNHFESVELKGTGDEPIAESLESYSLSINELPECLKGVQSIPPSLLPPFMRDYKATLPPPPDWGE